MAFSFRNLFQGDAPELQGSSGADFTTAHLNARSTAHGHVARSLMPFTETSPFSPAPAAAGTSPFQQGEVPDLLSLGLGPGPFSPRSHSPAPAGRPEARGPLLSHESTPVPFGMSPSSSPFAICQALSPGDTATAKDQSHSGSPATGGMPGFPTSGDPNHAPTMQPLKPSPSPFSLAEDPVQQGPQSILLSLHSALKDVAAKDLGFEASRIPKEVEVEIPLPAIQSQLASGRVLVPISLIQAGCEERFRPAFVRADPDLLVELPIAEIFRALPQSQDGDAAPAPRSPFSTLSDFAQPAAIGGPGTEVYEESINEGLSGAQLLGVQPKPESPFTPTFSGQERRLEPASSLPQAQMPADGGGIPSPPPPSFLQNAPQPPLPASPDTAAREEQGTPPPATQARAIPQVTAPTPSPLAPPEPSPAPRSPSAQLPGLQFGYDDDPDQIVLRALFGSQIRFTPQSTVERCAALPGITACATIREGKVIHHSDDHSAAAEEFRLAAPGVLRRVVDLTHELGLEDLDTFTIRARVGTVSFFLDANLCLAVLHAAQDLPPGTRERLIVISRELAKLSRQRQA